MEAGTLRPPAAAAVPGIVGRSPLLRLQGDEKLISLIRRGHHGAFEALVQRYQARLLSFCRHMLGSTEDAEDVLQEVFAAAFNAIRADNRPINARPWLYRIARNRCLNHLRRPVPSGQDSMDVFERDGGQTTADTVHKREEFRQIVADVQELPETQRTALLLREIDALSYEHIAEAMDTTVPSVKSLLVRARVSLAEAAEARLLTCAEVRLELGEVAEGLARTTAPVRRHLKGCERCRVFRGELRKSSRALAAVYPIGPLIIVKKLVVGKLGLGAGATTSGSGAGLAGGAAAGAGTAGGGAGGILSAGLGALATKAVAGVAAAAIVTAGAVEAPRDLSSSPSHSPAQSVAAPVAVGAAPQPDRAAAVDRGGDAMLAHRLAPPPAASPAQSQPAAARPQAAAKPAGGKAQVAKTSAAPQPAPAVAPAPATKPADPAATATTTTPQSATPVATASTPPKSEQESSTVTIGGTSGSSSGSDASSGQSGSGTSPQGAGSGASGQQTSSGQGSSKQSQPTG